VAFLAIPSVDPQNNGPFPPPLHPARTPAQVASYISIVTSIGSIIVGLLLVRQYRVKPKETVEEAANFLSSRTHATRGVETLAILYSLPYALLLWGMLTFLCAFSIENFITKDRAPIYATGVAWVIVGCLILWCIYAAWDDNTVPLWQRVKEDVESKWTAVREHNQEFMKKILPVRPVVPPAHPPSLQSTQASVTPSAIPMAAMAAAAPSSQRSTDGDGGGEYSITVEPSSAVEPSSVYSPNDNDSAV